MKAGYQEYMRSLSWRGTRRRRLAIDHHQCRTCGHDGSLYPLTVHHISYDRLGHERMSDLITLCSSCHQAVTDAAQRRRQVAALTTNFEPIEAKGAA